MTTESTQCRNKFKYQIMKRINVKQKEIREDMIKRKIERGGTWIKGMLTTLRLRNVLRRCASKIGSQNRHENLIQKTALSHTTNNGFPSNTRLLTRHLSNFRINR